MDYIRKVKEFHRTVDHPVNEMATEKTNTRQLRIKLLFEELAELSEASDCKGTFYSLCKNHLDNLEAIPFDGNTPNYREELDALCDLMYVLAGKILTGGYHWVFNDAFAEVHRSNMSKVCQTLDDVEKTMEYYNEEYNIPMKNMTYKQIGKAYVVYHKDGKVLKNVNYKPANIYLFIKQKNIYENRKIFE